MNVPLDPRLLQSHGRKMQSLSTQAKKTQQALEQLQKTPPPSDASKRKAWDAGLETLAKGGRKLGKDGKRLVDHAKQSQKVLDGDDAKKFKSAVFSPVEVVFKLTKGVDKTAAGLKRQSSQGATQPAGTSADGEAMKRLKTAQLQVLNLQENVQKHALALQMMSNASKASHEKAMSVIKNLKA